MHVLQNTVEAPHASGMFNHEVEPLCVEERKDPTLCLMGKSLIEMQSMYSCMMQLFLESLSECFGEHILHCQGLKEQTML